MNNILTIDIHGMTTLQAKNRILRAIKNINSQVSIIRVIHGYNNGNALKNMVRREFRNHPKVSRIELSMNQGITDLIIRRY